jgi:hypothetical protein
MMKTPRNKARFVAVLPVTARHGRRDITFWFGQAHQLSLVMRALPSHNGCTGPAMAGTTRRQQWKQHRRQQH